MRIKLEGKVVCSICGAIWRPYRGLNDDEPVQCESCGARQNDDYPFDIYYGEEDRLNDR